MRHAVPRVRGDFDRRARLWHKAHIIVNEVAWALNDNPARNRRGGSRIGLAVWWLNDRCADRWLRRVYPDLYR